MRHTAALLAAIIPLLLGATALRCLWRPDDRRAIQPVDTGVRIDLNTADRATLMLLPGIGATAADRIIARREGRDGGVGKQAPRAGRTKTTGGAHRDAGVVLFHTPADLDDIPRLQHRAVLNLTPYVTCGSRVATPKD